MKREPVLIMLKKRLADAKWSMKDGREFNDLVGVLGGRCYSEQFFKNCQTDIEQLEYLIKCLKEKP